MRGRAGKVVHALPNLLLVKHDAMVPPIFREDILMFLLQTTGLFILTALAEIVGCFLPYFWLRKGGSIWLLVPAALSLALFSWLLTLHPAASGRVYAAYGGVYVATALVWLKVVDGEDLSFFDWTGAGIALLGMGVIVLGWTAKP